MKIDTSKKIRNVAGEHILIRVAADKADMTEVVGLNDSAMDLYRALGNNEFSLDDVVRHLTDLYDVDEPTARRDAQEWVTSMRQQGLIID